MQVHHTIHGCSVVVGTYNRVMWLKHCLAALRRQDYQPFEIIIVDDGSTDGTAEYLRQLNDSRVRVIRHDQNRGLSAARNTGIAHAKFPVVAFTDDDCEADRAWVSRLVAVFADAGVGLAMGEVFYVRRGYRGYFPERVVQNLGAVWPKGCNMAYRREVFAAAGNFSDHYYRCQNEDTEMAIRAVAHGYRFCRVPAAVVCHQPAHWTARALLATANNAAVWPQLKRDYPRHYRIFGSPVRWGCVAHPEDYAVLLLLPLVLPALLVRYLGHGKRDLKMFFTKWPLLLVLRRYRIWRAAIASRVLML